MYWSRILDGQCVLVSKLTKSWWGLLKVIEYAHCLLLVVVVPQVQLNTGGLQYIRLAQPVSGAQVVQGQIQTLTTSTQQVQHKNATNVMICLWNPGSIYHSSCCFIIYVVSFKKKKKFCNLCWYLNRTDHFAVSFSFGCLSRRTGTWCAFCSVGRYHRQKCSKGNSSSTSSLMVR